MKHRYRRLKMYLKWKYNKLREKKDYYEYIGNGYKIRTRKKRPDLLDEVLGTTPNEVNKSD